MIYYKNISFTTKTFYGVKFNPGETHGVPGYITNSNMIRVGNANVISTQAPTTEEPVKSARGRKKRANVETVSIVETESVDEIETSNAQIDLITNKIEEELDNGSN